MDQDHDVRHRHTAESVRSSAAIGRRSFLGALGLSAAGVVVAAEASGFAPARAAAASRRASSASAFVVPLDSVAHARTW
ncbi:MAG: hypothetical protein ACRDNS_35560, partial [Trebonia sp.]